VNLYTHAIRSMAKNDTLEKHYQEIVNRIDTIITYMEELMENPLFMDNITGEQELNLDMYLELLDSIMVQFEPEPTVIDVPPQFESESFDAD